MPKDRLSCAGSGVCICTSAVTVQAIQVCTPVNFASLEIVAVDILNAQPPASVIACYSPLLAKSAQEDYD